MNEEEYSSLIEKLYGFEEYYYYKQNVYYKDYLFIINELDKIKRNAPMDNKYKNAIIGWYIYFKNSKRKIDSSHICVQITDACQLKCKHCCQQQRHRENKYMSYDEFVHLFYKHQDISKKFIHFNPLESNIISVVLEGGEATLNPDIYKIIRFLNNKNISVQLLTNGLNISNDLIDSLKLYSGNKVQVSIDGFKDTHDFIRGQGTFDKSINNIKRLLENNIEVYANMTIHESNYHEHIPLKKFIKDNIGCNFGEMLYTPQKESNLQFLSKDKLLHFLENMKVSKFDKSCNSTFICRIGEQIIINTNGDVLYCERGGYNGSIANYFTDDDETILHKLKTYAIRLRSVPVYCFDCKKVSKCLGGMLCNNIIKNNEYILNTEDRTCKLLSKKEIGEIYEIRTDL